MTIKPTEARCPHGYTPETWAAKQAEVAEFSRRNPYDDPATGVARKRNSEARLNAAATIQCADVPDQFALVRRGDILNVLHELIRHRAGHELAIERRSSTPQEPDDDAEWLRTFKAFVEELDNHEAVTVNRDSVMHHIFRVVIIRLQAKAPETDYSGIVVVDEADFTRGEE